MLVAVAFVNLLCSPCVSHLGVGCVHDANQCGSLFSHCDAVVRGESVLDSAACKTSLAKLYTDALDAKLGEVSPEETADRRAKALSDSFATAASRVSYTTTLTYGRSRAVLYVCDGAILLAKKGVSDM